MCLWSLWQLSAKSDPKYVVPLSAESAWPQFQIIMTQDPRPTLPNLTDPQDSFLSLSLSSCCWQGKRNPLISSQCWCRSSHIENLAKVNQVKYLTDKWICCRYLESWLLSLSLYVLLCCKIEFKLRDLCVISLTAHKVIEYLSKAVTEHGGQLKGWNLKTTTISFSFP